MENKFTISSEGELGALTKKIAKMLKPSMAIGLSGELGVGKTTLVRYLAQALGYSGPVSSPTFALCHEYPVSEKLVIEHWDLYRLLAAPEELLEAPDDRTIRLIEWPEKVGEIDRELDLRVSIEVTEFAGMPGVRLVRIG